MYSYAYCCKGTFKQLSTLLNMDEEQQDAFLNNSLLKVLLKNDSELTAVKLNVKHAEEYSTGEKIVFTVIACISILSSTTAITFLNRTKKIPKASKFLSTALLSFDVYFIMVSSLRKYIVDHTISLNIQTSVALSVQLAHLTVCIMAIERYLLILKPMWYIRTVSLKSKSVRVTVVFIWLLDVLVSMFVRYGVCYLRIRSFSVFTEAEVCDGIMSTFYVIIIVMILTTSAICYYKIFKCIQSKNNSGGVTSLTRMYNYRSTFLVFVYLMVITVSSLAFGIIIILIKIQKIRYTQVRLAMELVSIFNCLIDPFLYVLWFKECRLQLVMFLGRFLKSYRQKAEIMRMDVFNIVTTRNI